MQLGIFTRLRVGRRISYTRFDRTIEYVGKLDELLVVMDSEDIVPKGNRPQASRTIHRRFTDICRPVDDVFKLAVRQRPLSGSTEPDIPLRRAATATSRAAASTGELEMQPDRRDGDEDLDTTMLRTGQSGALAPGRPP